MLKLYKIEEGILKYWETWDKDQKTGIIHWGIVGQRGEDKEIKSGFFSNFKKAIQKEVDQKLAEGYREFAEDKMLILEIQYHIIDFGTNEDLEKRHRLENKLDSLLGWTGLGNLDGGSIGNGTMEVACEVVNFEIAKNVIEINLKDTEFSNYSKIVISG